MPTRIFAGFFADGEREDERESNRDTDISAISSFLAGISLRTALDFIAAQRVLLGKSCLVDPSNLPASHMFRTHFGLVLRHVASAVPGMRS